jgi:hypothetical protein
VKNISIQSGLSKTWLFILIIVSICLALFWTGTSGLDERVVTNRFFLFSLTALVAFLTPYILFPDNNLAVIQLGNFSASSIQNYFLKKILRLIWPVYLLIFLIFFGDLQTPFAFLFEKLILFAGSLLLLSGVILVSIVRYSKSGKSSQYWKESAKGERQKLFSEYLKYQQVDPSSLPSLINTIVVFSMGSLSIVIGAVIQQNFSLYFELIFFLIIFIYGIYFLKKHSFSLDQNFYASDSFFREFFGDTGGGEMATSKREVDQLWWVPARLKMHVWQFLLQIDRKIPAGRAVAAGHAAVWFIAYQRPDPQFLTIIWVLFAIAHQLFTVMSIQQEVSPFWMLRWIDKNSIWTLSRFWMQLRWLVPLLLSMNVQYFLFGVPGFEEQSYILLIYILSALFTSIVGTVKLKQDFKT